MHNILTSIPSVPDMVGMVGVILTLLAYYYINAGKWSANSLAYVLMNLFGSSFLMFSLLFTWNLASVLIEIAWIAISVIGLIRYLRHSHRTFTQD